MASGRRAAAGSRWSPSVAHRHARAPAATSQRYRWGVSSWFDHHVRSPLDGLLRKVPVGGQTVDADDCARLSNGIDALFRTEVASQYTRWPAGSTTDGTVVSLITRDGECSLEAIGMTHIDFDGRLFPSRALFTVSPVATHVAGFIGEVDENDGEPPRFVRGTMINTPLGPGGALRKATLLGRHRELDITWTKAFEVTHRIASASAPDATPSS